jgi:hypothetical protein
VSASPRSVVVKVDRVSACLISYQIIDIGCGEGELLAVLCQPAPSLPPPGPDVLSSSSDGTSTTTDLSDLDLHPRRVDGLDISSHALASAIEDTSPASANELYTRWEPLKVNIWHGGLEVFNPTFVNVECIVATEVYVYPVLRTRVAKFKFLFFKYRAPS